MQKIIRTSTCRLGSYYSGLVPLAGLEPARSCLRGILSPLCLPFHHSGVSVRNKDAGRSILASFAARTGLSYWRHHPESDRGMKALQASALPLGYGAVLERKTRFELATFALARQRSTTEPLPHAPGLTGAYILYQNIGQKASVLAPVLQEKKKNFLRYGVYYARGAERVTTKRRIFCVFYRPGGA